MKAETGIIYRVRVWNEVRIPEIKEEKHFYSKLKATKYADSKQTEICSAYITEIKVS